MKVLVTGASGKLGSRVVSCLVAEHHDVVATDRRLDPSSPHRVHVRDLTDDRPWAGLLKRVSAVVHCGAVSRPTGGSPFEILSTNVLGTWKLLEACLEAGVGKFVFASTIQVVASELTPDEEPPQIAYLPLDGDSPVNPRNPYAFSKAVGEMLLATRFVGEGRECQSLRFPWLVEARQGRPWGRQLRPFRAREPKVVVEQGFTCLSFADAARLIRVCLETHLPGHRVYYPAVCVIPAKDIPRYVARYYSAVTLKRPLEDLVSLVDTSIIESDTGWTPQDVPRLHTVGRKASRLRRVLRRG